MRVQIRQAAQAIHTSEGNGAMTRDEARAALLAKWQNAQLSIDDIAAHVVELECNLADVTAATKGLMSDVGGCVRQPIGRDPASGCGECSWCTAYSLTREESP